MPAFVPLSLPSAEKHGAAVVLCFEEYTFIFNCMPQFDNFEFGGQTTETEVSVQDWKRVNNGEDKVYCSWRT